MQNHCNFHGQFSNRFSKFRSKILTYLSSSLKWKAWRLLIWKLPTHPNVPFSERHEFFSAAVSPHRLQTVSNCLWCAILIASEQKKAVEVMRRNLRLHDFWIHWKMLITIQLLTTRELRWFSPQLACCLSLQLSLSTSYQKNPGVSPTRFFNTS